MPVLPAPNLGDDRVREVRVGLRPCRTGGLRLEIDRVTHGDSQQTIVHNYGQGGCGLTIGFGCAQVAADLVEQVIAANRPSVPALVRGSGPITVPERPRVAVLGAGVIGLTSARELASRGNEVVIYAEQLGNATTSGIAGGLWLPTGIEFGDTPHQRAQFHNVLHRSRRVFEQIDRTRFRVSHLPVFEPDGSPYEPHFFDNGTVAPPRPVDRLPLAGRPRAGRVFYTDFIHTHGFLNALYDDVAAAGVGFIETALTSIEDVLALECDICVNCLGLGSRTIFSDEAVFPARGILVMLEPEPLEYIVHDGYKYMFPREDALILGGCYEPGVTDLTPDAAIVSDILEHHRAFFRF